MSQHARFVRCDSLLGGAVSKSEFDARVVVTSSTTVADIPALMQALSALRPLLDEMEMCRSELSFLVHQVASFPSLENRSVALARFHVEEARASLRKSMRDLIIFNESLGTCALSYSAAEGDAASFAQLRAWLYPSPLSVMEAITGGGASFFQPLRHQHSQKKRPWRQTWYSGRVRDLFPPTFQSAAASSAIYGAIFATGWGSDPTDSWAMQFHVEDVSRGLMRTTQWVYQGEKPTNQVWGANATHATPEAAGVAASALFGWARLYAGSNNSVLLGRPREESPTGHPSGAHKGKSGILRILRNPRSHNLSRTLLPGANGLSQFFTIGSGLGVLPEGALSVSSGDVASALNNSAPHTGIQNPEILPRHKVSYVETPREASALIERIGALAEGQEHGEFEILKHETQGPGGTTRSWSVIIRGTQHWTAEGTNIQDLHTNLNAVAGLESDQTRAIKAAMADVGIKPTEAVEFVGHSQGGIIASQLASDAEVSSRYKVAAVLTAGAPTAGYDPNTSVGMLNLENTRDQVPALDGRGNNDHGNNLTVHFDGNLLGRVTPEGRHIFAHDMSVYRDAMKHFEEAPTKATEEVSAWVAQRSNELNLQDSTISTSYVYTTRRSSL